MKTFYNFTAGFLFGLFLVYAQQKLHKTKPINDWIFVPAGRYGHSKSNFIDHVQLANTNSTIGWLVISNTVFSTGYAYPARR